MLGGGTFPTKPETVQLLVVSRGREKGNVPQKCVPSSFWTGLNSEKII